MPAPVTSSSKSSKLIVPKAQVPASLKKSRVIRRRGRAKSGIDSEDEIEREARSHSDSDSSLLNDSATDSESEAGSDDVLRHCRALTPSTIQSPPPPVDVAPANGTMSKPSSFLANGHVTSVLAAAADWSEMVAEENAYGAAELPVIDFADLHYHIGDSFPPSANHGPSSSRTIHKSKSSATLSAASTRDRSSHSVPPPLRENMDVAEHEDGDAHPIASSSHLRGVAPLVRRPVGQTARQAYQQRLEKDPSYVPTLGEFWGHDDRLLDKDLRSLSGWWRGRWQGRGRGRGGFEVRNRGSFSIGGQTRNISSSQGGDRFDSTDLDVSAPEVAPIERAWTHDGFEEMKRRDEGFRSEREQEHQQQGQMFTPFRGRGGRGRFFRGARGRGDFTRGRVSPSYTRSPGVVPPVFNRLWFATKPERMWTKQHDGFLYIDVMMRARPGQGQGICVKLPGATGHLVSATPGYEPRIKQGPTPVAPDEEDEFDKKFVVRIPRKSGKRMEQDWPIAEAVVPDKELATTIEELRIDDHLSIRAKTFDSASLKMDGASLSASLPEQTDTWGAASVVSPTQVHQNGYVSVSREVVAESSNPLRVVETPLNSFPQDWNVVQPIAVTANQRSGPPSLTPLQTAFSPVQPSPIYGSPYGYLPPGIAISQHGVPYDVSTGQAVYLQPTPPPRPPMYNPQPLAHHTHLGHTSGLSFIPGHINHRSTVSPDFVTQPHTPVINGFVDLSIGAPIFAMPRQSSRIEIRAPTGETVAKESKVVQRSSTLRTTSQPFQPSQRVQASVAQQQQQLHYSITSTETLGLPPYQSGDGGVAMDDPAQQAMIDPAVMAYYQQQYYYPEQYGYAAYPDMSQQAIQYDIYPGDPCAQPTIYY